MKPHWAKKLYRVKGLDNWGRVTFDTFVQACSHHEAWVTAVRTATNDEGVMTKEWCIREYPTPDKFNSNTTNATWGTPANRKVAKMRRRRNYVGATIYQVDHDYRFNRVARELIDMWRTTLNLK